MLDEIHNVDDEGYVPDYLTQDRIERRFEQRYELMLKRREMAGTYHTSHGHSNNLQTVLNLQAKGIECNHLKRYILAHRCDACDAAPGRRHHKVKATKKAKRKAKSIIKTAAPVAAVTAPAFDSQNPLAEQLDLEFSTITDAIDPITESLALIQSLNPWHVYFSTRQRTFLTILTSLRCVICQVLQKTLPILTLVKALQQALVAKALHQTPILQHHFSHHPALICAWIGGMPEV